MCDVKYFIMKLLLQIVFCCFIGFNAVFAQFPSNMYPDPNAPFIYGVASGDPLSDRVIIWTKVEPTIPNPASITLDWEVAKDQNFFQIVQNGTINADASTNWTVQIDVDGLQPHATYFYRFTDSNGARSVVGRTRTAPTGGSVDHIRMAVGSCSSVFSGFFNAYQRIAEREDLDVVIHLGDYIYDTVDEDEEVRIPIPYPSVPNSLEEWRDRHEYYLMDPDLREARRMHPWIALWDNHDIDGSGASYLGSIQAFQEYLPIRRPDSADVEKIYRKLSYGDILDIFVADILLYRNQDVISGNDYSILGDTQYNWLTNELLTSTAQWKIVANQNMMCGWSVVGFPSWFPLGNGSVLDETTWDGFDVARDQFLDFLSDNDIDNVLVLSGDSHVSIAADLSVDPYDGAVYDGDDGDGSVAVEFLPTSISRGNLDEMGISSILIPVVESASELANPNHVYTDYEQHGYGIVNIKPDTLTAEFWYSDILSLSNTESMGAGVFVKDNVNHWERVQIALPTPPKEIPYDTTTVNTGIQTILGGEYVEAFNVYPNPSSGIFTIEMALNMTDDIAVQIIEPSTGRVLKTENIGEISEKTPQKFTIDIYDMPTANYMIRLLGEHVEITYLLQKI